MSPPPRENVHTFNVRTSQGLDMIGPCNSRVAIGCGECQVRHLQKGGGAAETAPDPSGVGRSKPTQVSNPGENIVKTTDGPLGKAEPPVSFGHKICFDPCVKRSTIGLQSV